MAAGIGLNTGLRALLSSRFALDTIGHNIANANTPGYSRQRVDLGAAAPLLNGGVLIGSGVDATSVRRTVDNLLTQRILVQTSARGRLESRFSGLSEVEALFREPEGNSLGAQIDGIFSAASNLSANPTDAILRAGLVNAATQATSQFTQLSGSLASIRRDTAREIEIRVEEVNELAAQISGLNQEIAAVKSAGLAPNDLMDSRDLAISKLSEIVNLETQADQSGAVRVLVSGNTLVSTTRFHPMRATATDEGAVTLEIQGASVPLKLTGGVLGGLTNLTESSVPRLLDDLDRLALNLIREVNRVHSTGVPASGPYSSLVGGNVFVDVDRDGAFRDELLSDAGLPTDVASGDLFVNVTQTSTGLVEKHRITTLSSHTTVGDFLDALTDIPHLAADIDALGRMQIVADAGYGFDFSRRVDPNPDQVGAFGGGQAAVSSPVSGPFALSDGDVLQLSVGGTPVDITFSASGFEQIAAATAEEIAAVVNADANAIANGITADTSGGRLVLASSSPGSGTSFDVVGGSALGPLQLTSLAGATVTGHDTDVDVTISGQYTGAANGEFRFRAASDGTIGTTPGLAVDVFDQAGQRVATLDVGPGYVPGTALEVAHGISVSFGLGELSATHNDAFSVDVLADSDTADVLVAVGLASFFTGSGADDIALHPDIEADPNLIASSLTGSDGDNGTLLELLDVEGAEFAELGAATIGEFYGALVGELGFEVSTTVDSLEANETLLSSLELREEQVSGVNVDEELVDLLQFEQAFQAASRFISVLGELNDDLLSLL